MPAPLVRKCETAEIIVPERLSQGAAGRLLVASMAGPLRELLAGVMSQNIRELVLCGPVIAANGLSRAEVDRVEGGIRPAPHT